MSLYETAADAVSGSYGGMLEACYSGSFVSAQAKSTRVVITSSGADQFSYFSDDGSISFGQFLSNRLMTGETWSDAFDKAVQDLTKIGPPYAAMVPQKLVGSAVTMGKVYGTFTMGGLLPELKGYSKGGQVNANVGLQLAVQLEVADAVNTTVWAMVMPPDYAPPTTEDAFSTPPLNLERVDLLPQAGMADYSASYLFSKNGNHQVTIYVQDCNGMVVSSPPQIFTVSGGIEVSTTTTTSTTLAVSQTSTTTTLANGGMTLTLPVAEGWSLLSSAIGFTAPVLLSNAATETSVWKWADGASGKTWAVYLPGDGDGGAAYAASKGFLLLDAINPGEGFWVNAKQAHQLEVSGVPDYGGALVLSEGWNLVGLRSAAAATVTLITAAQSGIASLWTWENNTWSVALPDEATPGAYAMAKGFGQLSTIQPGAGVWVDLP